MKLTDIRWKMNSFGSAYAYIDPSIYNIELKAELIKKAYESTVGKSRYCFHNESESQLNFMLICHTKKALVVKHKHEDRSEYFLLIEGQCKIREYDGDVKKEIHLSEINPIFKVEKNIEHEIEITSDYILFYEVK